MDEDKPWVRLNPDDDNPSIRGNAQGLRHLRNKIDEAIDGGRSMMEDFDCDFEQIEISNNYPKAKKVGFGFRIMMIILAVILILGLIALIVIIGTVFSEFSSRWNW
jgi:hypothetical protein